MKNSGMSIIGIIFSLVIIALLTVIVMKNMGLNDSKNYQKSMKAPVEKAKAVECTLKVDGLNKAVMTYKMTNEKLPGTLDEITNDYRCPIVNLPYHYDPASGKVWCPEHDQE